MRLTVLLSALAIILCYLWRVYNMLYASQMSICFVLRFEMFLCYLHPLGELWASKYVIHQQTKCSLFSSHEKYYIYNNIIAKLKIAFTSWTFKSITFTHSEITYIYLFREHFLACSGVHFRFHWPWRICKTLPTADVPLLSRLLLTCPGADGS